MSLLPIERQIIKELQKITSNKKIGEKNLMEWSTTKVKAQEGEKLIHLKDLGVYVAYRITN